MLADDTAYVLAIRTGLASETRRVRGEAHWQTGAIEYLITVKIGKRHFRGRDQPEFLLAVRHAKQIGCEFGELPCSVHRLGIDQVRRKHFSIAVFTGVQVEHEVGEGSLQLRTHLPVHGKTRAGKLGSALEIEYAKLLTNFPMRLGREIKVRRRAPAADLDIIFGSLANGHAVVWDVRNSGKHLVQAGLIFCRGFFFL